jgi:hypothetical protein
MKTILCWLCDPYVHLFAIGLLLVWLAMGIGTESDEPEDRDLAPVRHASARSHQLDEFAPVVYAPPRGP